VTEDRGAFKTKQPDQRPIPQIVKFLQGRGNKAAEPRKNIFSARIPFAATNFNKG
jgi:hypothetical protein